MNCVLIQYIRNPPDQVVRSYFSSEYKKHAQRRTELHLRRYGKGSDTPSLESPSDIFIITNITNPRKMFLNKIHHLNI